MVQHDAGGLQHGGEPQAVQGASGASGRASSVLVAPLSVLTALREGV